MQQRQVPARRGGWGTVYLRMFRLADGKAFLLGGGVYDGIR